MAPVLFLALWTLADPCLPTPDVYTLGEAYDPAQYNGLPLPSQATQMQAGEDPRATYVWVQPKKGLPDDASGQVTQGDPKKLDGRVGSLESKAAEATGQMTVGGINVSDGHVTRVEEDLGAPDHSRRLTFTRTYNNQYNQMGPLGAGWAHEHEGYLQAEGFNRFSVVVGGQGRDFPYCGNETRDNQDHVTQVTDCEGDGTHHGKLTVKFRYCDRWISALGTYEDLQSGRVYTFGKDDASGSPECYGLQAVDSRPDRVKVLLAEVDDGLADSSGTAEAVQYAYLAGSNLVEKVYRTNGPVMLALEYEDFTIGDNTSLLLDVRKRQEGLKRLKKVTLCQQASGGQGQAPVCGTTVDSVEFDHDTQGTACPGATVPAGMKLGLLIAACRGANSADEVSWLYTYEAIRKRDGSAVQGTELQKLGALNKVRYGNELKRAELRTGGKAMLRAEYTWGSPSGTCSLPDNAWMAQAEVGCTAQIPGSKAKVKVDYTALTTRGVTREDGVAVTVTLSAMGLITNVSGAETGSASWEVGSETATGTPKRVATTVATDGNGNQTTPTLEGGLSLRATDQSTALGSMATHDPVGGTRVTVKHSGFLTRYPLATTLEVPGGNGLALPATAAFDDKTGAMTGLQLESGGTGFSTTPDTRGMPVTGKDLSGNTLSYELDTTGFKQVKKVTVTLAGGGGTGTQSVVRTNTYDTYGRVKQVTEDVTQKDEQWDYDRLGRLTRHEQIANGNSSLGGENIKREWVFTAGQGDGCGTGGGGGATDVACHKVEEKLNGATVRTQHFENGVLKQEDVAYDASSTENVTYTYDDDGWISQVKHGSRETVDYTRNTRGQVTQEKRTRGTFTVTTDYTRDTNGNVTKTTVTDVYDRKTETELDKLGQPAKWTYDPSTTWSEVESVKRDQAGNELERSWGDSHTVKYTVDKVGKTTNDDDAATPKAVEVVRAFDSAGRVTSEDVKHAERNETVEYKDVFGRVTQRVVRGKVAGEDGNLAEERLTETRSWNNLVATVTRTVGSRTKNWKETYNSLGQMVELEEDLPDGTKHKVQFAYEGHGQVKTRKDLGSGETVDNTYDAQGALRISSDGLTTVTHTLDGGGVATTTVTSGPRTNEKVTETRDGWGRLLSRQVDALNNGQAANWSWAYSGNTITETPPAGDSIDREVDARGRVRKETRGTITKEYTYDGAAPSGEKTTEGTWSNDVKRVMDAAGKATRLTEKWQKGSESYTYTTSTSWATLTGTESWSDGSGSGTATVRLDSLGNAAVRVAGDVTVVRAVGLDGVPLFERGARMGVKRYTVTQGRVMKETLDIDDTSYTYDAAGRVKTVTNPLGHTSTLTYHSNGKPQKRTDNAAWVTVTDFDAAGLPTTVKQGGENGKVWTYKHGALGEVLSVQQPVGGTHSFTYEADGALATMQPPGGPQWSFGYDGQRRVKSRTHGNLTWNMPVTDGETNLTSPGGLGGTELVDGRGRPAKQTFTGAPGLTAVTYTYDSADNLREVTETVRGLSLTTTYGTNGDAREVTSVARDSVTVNAARSTANEGLVVEESGPGGAVTYKHDSRGYLAAVVVAAMTLSTPALAGGLLQNVGTEETWEYVNGLPSKVTHPGGTIEYTYDERGNRLTQTVTRGLSTETTTYTYDDADRLTGVSYPDGSAVSYTLRGDGARTAETWTDANQVTTDVSYTRDSNDAISSVTRTTGTGVDAETLAWDADGRLTAWTHGGNTDTLVWDAADRLVSFTRNGVVTEYEYQFDRKRTAKTGVAYTWGLGGLVSEERATGVTRYLTGPLGFLGEVTSGTLTQYHRDALGSVVGKSGGYRADFRAFGETTAAVSGPGFAQLYGDVESGFNYARDRTEIPGLGVFASRDPVLGSPKNLRAMDAWLYVGHAPTRYTDPSGRNAIPRACLDEPESEACANASDPSLTERVLGQPPPIGLAPTDAELERMCPQEVGRRLAPSNTSKECQELITRSRERERNARMNSAAERGVDSISWGFSGCGGAGLGAEQLRSMAAGGPFDPEKAVHAADACNIGMFSTAGARAMRGAASDASIRAATETRIGLGDGAVAKAVGDAKGAAVSQAPVTFKNKFPKDEILGPRQLFTAAQVTRKTFTRYLNYVVKADGRLVLGRGADDAGHIDLAFGEPVLAAGEVHFVRGEVRYLDNSSGHYQPGGPSAEAAVVRAFEAAGIPARGRYVEKAWDPNAGPHGAWVKK